MKVGWYPDVVAMRSYSFITERCYRLSATSIDVRKKNGQEYRRDRSTATKAPLRHPAAIRHSGTCTMTFLFSDIEGATRAGAVIETMP